MYRDLPPLEYHMKVSIECRQEHILQVRPHPHNGLTTPLY